MEKTSEEVESGDVVRRYSEEVEWRGVRRWSWEM